MLELSDKDALLLLLLLLRDLTEGDLEALLLLLLIEGEEGSLLSTTFSVSDERSSGDSASDSEL
jgi:hypothetical protein